MVEILINLIDATHADTVKDRRGSYKRGDPVVVMSDGHEWGLKETPPKFGVLRITGITAEQAKKYLAPEEETIEGYVFPDGSMGPLTRSTRRRRFGFQLSDVPARIRNEIQTGFTEVTFQQVRNFIKNKKTGATE